MTANPLATTLLLNQLPSSYLNPLLAQPNLNAAAGFANTAGLGVGVNSAAAGGAAAMGASDQSVQLANVLSRLMLGSAQQSLALGLLTPGVGTLNPFGLLANPGVAAYQNLLSATSGTSLLSPSDQQQLLMNAGLLSMPSGQTGASHSGAGATPMSSGGSQPTVSIATVSGSTPAVSRNPAGMSAQAGSHTPAAAVARPLFETIPVTHASRRPPPK